MEKKTTQENKAPKEVRNHTFGCMNCLFEGAECKNASMYKELKTNKKGCGSYCYFD